MRDGWQWMDEADVSAENDLQLTNAVRGLDPAVEDPNYWLRFQGWVVTSARAELTRRRLMVELTMGDVMSSWARALVPSALLAAAVAGLLAVGPPAPSSAPLSVEELLVSGLDGEDPIPDRTASVTFVSELF